MCLRQAGVIKDEHDAGTASAVTFLPVGRGVNISGWPLMGTGKLVKELQFQLSREVFLEYARCRGMDELDVIRKRSRKRVGKGSRSLVSGGLMGEDREIGSENLVSL